MAWHRSCVHQARCFNQSERALYRNFIINGGIDAMYDLFVFRLSYPGYLLDLSVTVVPREKTLEQSVISLKLPSQWEARLNWSSPDFGITDNVLAILPTGFGKSLLFQLIPGLRVALNRWSILYTDPESPIIIVVFPLNQLSHCFYSRKSRGYGKPRKQQAPFPTISVDALKWLQVPSRVTRTMWLV